MVNYSKFYIYLFAWKKRVAIVGLAYLYFNNMKTVVANSRQEMSKCNKNDKHNLWTGIHKGTLHPYGPHKPICSPTTFCKHDALKGM